MKQKTIDETLKCSRRSLRTLPGKLLFGPTGARLFADYLEEQPGFVGRIDFIHKLNLPGLFGFSLCDEPLYADDTTWRPSHTHTVYRSAALELKEDKWVSWDDCAVACLRWRNAGDSARTLTLFTLPDWEVCVQDGAQHLTRACVTHSLQLACVLTAHATLDGADIGAEDALLRQAEQPPRKAAAHAVRSCFALPAHASGKITVAAAVGEHSTDTWRALAARAKHWSDSDAPLLQRQKRQYESWFFGAPRFSCSDPLLEKTWAYRWFLLRHNYVQPRFGNLRHGLFYEGRSHKLAKAVDDVRGHEFTQLIPLSTPLHLTDARWKHGGKECRETILTLLDSADENGIFRTMKVDEKAKAYGNYAVWAAYQAIQVHPDTDFVRVVLPGLKKYVHGIGKVCCPHNDVLPVCVDHRLTGKEYQPSFWYFQGYPQQVSGTSSFQPLKRVDLAVYYYLNALGAAGLCDMAGDPEAAAFHALAQRIASAVLTRMWDEHTGFFYDLHPDTDEKALVKCVTGIYPLWADMPGVNAPRLLESFLREDTFALGSCFASVEHDCPVFSAQGGWNGLFFKGRNGCIWNGPSWPYTTGIALEALVLAERRGESPRPGAFMHFLREYALEHYRYADLAQPYLVEHYDSITGEMLSDEPDYLHSFFLDLVVRHIAGVTPVEGGLLLAPLKTELAHFCLENLSVAGHRIDVFLKAAHYRVLVDGHCVYQVDMRQKTKQGEQSNGIFIRL